MKLSQIRKLQREYGVAELQAAIDDGSAWIMEGSYGRAAMDALRSGACMLPKLMHRDYWGNIVPARQQLKKGTKGTFQNSVNYWTNVINDELL